LKDAKIVVSDAVVVVAEISPIRGVGHRPM
jgi:hypothetical protein